MLALATLVVAGETGVVAMLLAAILAVGIWAEAGEISNRHSRPMRRTKVHLALMVGDRDHDSDHQRNESRRHLAA